MVTTGPSYSPHWSSGCRWSWSAPSWGWSPWRGCTGCITVPVPVSTSWPTGSHSFSCAEQLLLMRLNHAGRKAWRFLELWQGLLAAGVWSSGWVYRTSQVRDTAVTEVETASSCWHWKQLLVTHVFGQPHQAWYGSGRTGKISLLCSWDLPRSRSTLRAREDDLLHVLLLVWGFFKRVYQYSNEI